MTLLTRYIAVLLLALWVPVTMHCELESTALSFLQCCCGDEDPAATPDSCGDAVCSAVESGFYKVEDDPSLVLPAMLLLSCTATNAAADELVSSLQPPVPEPQPPPDLSPGWRFSHRTALPPRAPSVQA